MKGGEDLAGLRGRVRELIAKWDFTPRCDAWLRGHDPAFSRALAAAGFIGITWPAELGGGGRSNLARLVVTEELLRAGAPVAAHWIADRQIGPAILRYGSADLRREYLPRIARGEVTFCLGMSETEAGSDLAAVRTVAEPAAGGWRLRGSKIWTSHAHASSHAYVLARTGSGGDKHAGLTEFIVDMSAAGVTVRPIHDLRGDHHFNEVVFDGAFVPAGHVLGAVGGGWRQVTEQLAFERGGMERVLSTYPLLAATIAAAPRTAAAAERIGAALARLAALRALAWRVAVAMDAGRAPIQEAAMLKDLGTAYEGDVNELARAVLRVEPDPDAGGDPAGLLAQGVLAAPGFTIRGGTTEVLRTIIARAATGAPGRAAESGSLPPEDDTAGLREIADDVLAGHGGEPVGSAVPTADGHDPHGEPPDTASGTAVETSGGAGGETAGNTGAATAGGTAIGLGGGTADSAGGGPVVSAGGGTALWETVCGLGWPGVGTPEALGGSGGTVGDLVVLVTACGRHAVSMPLAETAWARRLPAAAGRAAPEGVMTVVLPRDGEDLVVDGGTLSGAATRVPWACAAEHLVVVARDAAGTGLLLIVPSGAPGVVWEPGRNLAGEPRDTVRFDAVPVAGALPAADPVAVAAEGALLRAAAAVGAMETAVDHTVRHVTVREQFGRPLAAFQAVGATLAGMTAQLTLARTAVGAAVAGRDTVAVERAAAAAIVAASAATAVAGGAHQLHGAMGVTREHPLHLVTRRLWAWRDEFGGGRRWSGLLGERLLSLGPDGVWDWLTADPDGTEGTKGTETAT